MQLRILSITPDDNLHVMATTKDQHGNYVNHTITCSKKFYEELSTLVSQYESAKHLLSAAYGSEITKTFRNGVLTGYAHSEHVRDYAYERQGTE